MRLGHDPAAILAGAALPADLLGDPAMAIGGRSVVRLVRHAQFLLDDVYLGFLPHGCRLALENERLLSFLNCATFGEALRVSIRFTGAMSIDVGPEIIEDHVGGLLHICRYRTIDGVDRDTLVWIRFVWIYHFFSWLLGRPMALRGLSLSGPRPVQANGFDRFALFGCPVRFDAPFDAISYDAVDLMAPLVRRSITDYETYYAGEPDWFAMPGRTPSWSERTRETLIAMQAAGRWSAPVEAVAAHLRTRPRRLRHDLSLEGESFQEMRTRLRGELAAAHLLASDLPITTIGDMLGFSEPGSFSRHFLMWAGTPPSAYRTAFSGDAAKVAAATALLAERRIA